MGSVIKVRLSAHHRTASLGLTGGPRPCRNCGADIRFIKRKGNWRPVDAKSRKPHYCGWGER
jgi:hypothetical protein